MDWDQAPIIALMDKRADLIAQRDLIEAEIKSIDAKIANHRAIDRARWIGIRITKKTKNKAIHWGFIIDSLWINGPLSTAKLCSLVKIYLNTDNENTIRSYLHRMSLEGWIVQDFQKRWMLTEQALAARPISPHTQPSHFSG